MTSLFRVGKTFRSLRDCSAIYLQRACSLPRLSKGMLVMPDSTNSLLGFSPMIWLVPGTGTVGQVQPPL